MRSVVEGVGVRMEGVVGDVPVKGKVGMVLIKWGGVEMKRGWRL